MGISDVFLDHDYFKYYQLKQNDVVLDLGASLGELPRKFYDEFKRKNIFYIAVEPSVWCLRELSSFLTTYYYNNSMVISGGVSDESKIETFQVYDGYLLNRIGGVPDAPIGQKVRTENVPVYTLDYLISMIGHRINFVKCDIEGAELKAFMPSTKLGMIDYLAIASYHIVDGEKTMHKLKPFFESNGFEVTHDPGLGGAFDDLLFCRKV